MSKVLNCTSLGVQCISQIAKLFIISRTIGSPKNICIDRISILYIGPLLQHIYSYKKYNGTQSLQNFNSPQYMLYATTTCRTFIRTELTSIPNTVMTHCLIMHAPVRSKYPVTSRINAFVFATLTVNSLSWMYVGLFTYSYSSSVSAEHLELSTYG